MEKVYSENPMDRGLYNQIYGLDEEVFRDGIEQMLKSYDKLLKQVGDVKYLPKGTILYHGSLVYPFYAGSGKKKTITYLGLDMDISMWYIYELLMNQQYGFKSLKDTIMDSKSFKRYGFLYTFKVTKDLPITHVIDKLYLNPKDLRKCKKKNICLHPQVSYRGGEFNYNVGSNLHTELTLNYNSYKESIEMIRIYIVDGLSLHKNHSDIEYNVRTAILQEYSVGTDYELPISYQEYSEMFLGELFHCDHNCGFKGTFQDVVDHEKTCSAKAGTKSKKKKPKKKPKKTKKKQSNKNK
jgi:hypothetical protein